MIDLKNITVEFKKDRETFKAVDKVSLNVKPSEVFGIIGYSGAGKSTLIRTVNLLERPAEGKVIVDGEDLMTLSKSELLNRRKKIGMIFQHFNLMKNLSCLENVLFPIKKDNTVSKKERLEKAESFLERVGLSEYRNRYPSELSGGQKQRVAIARAIVGSPKILLCDEATSALDPRTTLEILELLKSLNEEYKLTIMLIAHQMEVVKEICSRVAFMEQGKIVEEGEIAQIFAKPRSDLSKRFMQTVNKIDSAMKNIREDENLKKVVSEGFLCRMTYKGLVAEEPLVVSFYEKFSVYTNILFGNLEYISGTPLGNLIVVFSGEKKNIEELFKYCEEKGVSVELLDVKEVIK